MNFILSISFIFLFMVQSIVPSIDLSCELQKLPLLFEHYEEHVEHDSTTLTEFLDFHYGNRQDAEDHHHDDEHDSKLPFHGQHHCCHGSVFISQTFQKIELLCEYNFTFQSNFTLYAFSISTKHLDSPLQPPQA